MKPRERYLMYRTFMWLNLVFGLLNLTDAVVKPDGFALILGMVMLLFARYLFNVSERIKHG